MHHLSRNVGGGFWISVPLLNLTCSTQFEFGVLENDGMRNYRHGLIVPLVWKPIPRTVHATIVAPLPTREVTVTGKKRSSNNIFRMKPHMLTISFNSNPGFATPRFGFSIVTAKDMFSINNICYLSTRLVSFRPKAAGIIGESRAIARKRSAQIHRLVNSVERRFVGKEKQLATSRTVDVKEAKAIGDATQIQIKFPYIPGYNTVHQFRNLVLDAIPCQLRSCESLHISIIWIEDPTPRARLVNTKEWGHNINSEDLPCTCAQLRKIIDTPDAAADENVGYVCMRTSNTLIHMPLFDDMVNYDTNSFPSLAFQKTSFEYAAAHIHQKANISVTPEPLLEDISLCFDKLKSSSNAISMERIYAMRNCFHGLAQLINIARNALPSFALDVTKSSLSGVLLTPFQFWNHRGPADTIR